MGDHGTRDGFVKTEEIANWIAEDALDYVRGGWDWLHSWRSSRRTGAGAEQY